MTLLDFEQPIGDLQEQLENAEKIAVKGNIDVTKIMKEIENQITVKKQEIYGNLTDWQRVQLSRHPDRPYTLSYINHITNGDFIELHGDRLVRDDKAIVGGFGSLKGRTVMFIGHQKGSTTKERQYRNFGMANPDGYRKALRLMRLAEKFNKPIVTFIDTMGAHPGIEAEKRGQAEAIARNMFEMFGLKIPVICIIIGEGASGGAIGIGVGDRVLMLEYTWYSVISPESCSSILWRSWDYKQEAAKALKLTPNNMLGNKLIDGIIKEPLGGAHNNKEEMFEIVKKEILKHLKTLDKLSPKERIEKRVEKFSNMGVYNDV